FSVNVINLVLRATRAHNHCWLSTILYAPARPDYSVRRREQDAHHRGSPLPRRADRVERPSPSGARPHGDKPIRPPSEDLVPPIVGERTESQSRIGHLDLRSTSKQRTQHGSVGFRPIARERVRPHRENDREENAALRRGRCGPQVDPSLAPAGEAHRRPAGDKARRFLLDPPSSRLRIPEHVGAMARPADRYPLGPHPTLRGQRRRLKAIVWDRIEPMNDRDSSPPRDDPAASRQRLVEELRASGISDERVLSAVASVPRDVFVPPEMRPRAYENVALPIEEHQTISQPVVVAHMAQAVHPTSVDRVLEVGTGSGYGAAVLGRLAGDVVTI